MDAIPLFLLHYAVELIMVDKYYNSDENVTCINHFNVMSVIVMLHLSCHVTNNMLHYYLLHDTIYYKKIPCIYQKSEQETI